MTPAELQRLVESIAGDVQQLRDLIARLMRQLARQHRRLTTTRRLLHQRTRRRRRRRRKVAK